MLVPLIVGVALFLMGSAGWTLLGIDGSLQVVGGIMVAYAVANWLYAAYIMRKFSDGDK